MEPEEGGCGPLRSMGGLDLRLVSEVDVVSWGRPQSERSARNPESQCQNATAGHPARPLSQCYEQRRRVFLELQTNTELPCGPAILSLGVYTQEKI